MTTRNRIQDFYDHRNTQSCPPPSPHSPPGENNGSGLCSHCGCKENNFPTASSSRSNSSIRSNSSSSISSSSSTITSVSGISPKPRRVASTPTSPQNEYHPNEGTGGGGGGGGGGGRGKETRIKHSRRSASCMDLNGNCLSGSTNRKAPSMTSLSKNVTAVRPFSVSLDSNPSSAPRTSERIHDPRDCVTKEAPVLYLTPLQRKERESREMKKEISRLYNELSQKDERIFQLQRHLEEQTKDYRDELERRIAEIQEMMEDKERVVESARQEKMTMEEELDKMAEMFTEIKVKQKLQEDQFQERYLDMYKRGQKAAMFEREQELEMIATSKQPKVTVRELTRKLSMTESELAKWQTLRLDETYKSAEKPLTDADVTLAFLKDSFFHFIGDKEDRLRHFRAIVEIFRYSDSQMCKIRKHVSESKDFARLFRKDIC